MSSGKSALGVEDVPTPYLDCRDWGHRWRHVNDRVTLGARKRIAEVYREAICDRCDTERSEILDVEGGWARTHVSYRYPDNYTISTGNSTAGRTRVADVRRALFQRAGYKVDGPENFRTATPAQHDEQRASA